MMKNIMILGLLILAVHFCFGQIETNELSLHQRDSTWIQKQQFPLLAYDGNNAAINERLVLNLNEILEGRTQSSATVHLFLEQFSR